MTTQYDPAATGWHLDKRVPIALIVVLVTQTFGMGWYMATLNGKVDQGAVDRVALAKRLSSLEMDRGDLRDRLTRVEVKIESQSQTLNEILKEVRGR